MAATMTGNTSEIFQAWMEQERELLSAVSGIVSSSIANLYHRK